MSAFINMAFENYRFQALWNVRHFEKPTPAQALAITKALRTYAGMDDRRLAEQIEKQCGPLQPDRPSI
jgi:uncharacterized protein YyaL (SSP411 family)